MRKATAAQFAPEPADDPELIVDRELKSPRPLDRNISTVTLKTPTNNPTEGYDLQLSATFGKERIKLISEEFEIEVDFSMNQANIEMSFKGCDSTEINDGHGGRVEEYRRTVTQQIGARAHTATRIAAGLNVSMSNVRPAAQVDGKMEKASTIASATKQEIVRHDWHRLGGEAIKVGPIGQHLDGPMITDFPGWRVTPHRSDVVSGVVARVKVRASWLNFDNVEVIKSPLRLRDKLKMLMSQDTKRKEYFNLLLRHLVQTELRGHQEGPDATIASHVLMVRPHAQRAMSPYPGESRRQVRIDESRLTQWLLADEGHEVGALIALGINPDAISPIAGEDEPKRAKRGSFFIPDSSPPHAAATFEQIYKAGSIAKAALLYPTTLHDLRALGLIDTDADFARSIVKEGMDPNPLMRRAVSNMECIHVTRQVLRINPNATSFEVADAVAIELGKHWPTPGTKRRNGNAIIRWTVWLEPHLLDATSSSDAAARIAYATDVSPIGKGRPASLRKTLEPELRRLLAKGLTKAEIARRLNVSTATVNNWRRKLKIK
jgi:hypothetical protein